MPLSLPGSVAAYSIAHHLLTGLELLHTASLVLSQITLSVVGTLLVTWLFCWTVSRLQTGQHRTDLLSPAGLGRAPPDRPGLALACDA